MRVRREQRAEEDGYSNAAVPGLRASADARRLAEEIALAVGRLGELASDPPGLYSEVASSADSERATWLAFVIAYLGPLDGVPDPFLAITSSGLVDWAGIGERAGGQERPPALEAAELGARSSHDPQRGMRTVEAYRAWVSRAGSQEQAFLGDPGWTPERRFDRVYERLAIPGLTRAARYDLLVILGRVGRYELRAASLHLGGDDPVTGAAKRVFGIGDTTNLERRAATLADELAVPIEALDLGLFNWSAPRRTLLGASALVPDPALVTRLQTALGL